MKAFCYLLFIYERRRASAANALCFSTTRKDRLLAKGREKEFKGMYTKSDTCEGVEATGPKFDKSGYKSRY